MGEQVEIIKQVKLTAAQRVALISAANDKGVLHGSDHGIRETLRYLGLVENRKLYTSAEIDKRVAEAWAKLRAAVRQKDTNKAEDAIGVIRSERWDREKTTWRLTAAAEEYLLKGRVIVTVGPRNEADTRAKLRA
jgi:hypothetical protein